jgi:hypothetical protein
VAVTALMPSPATEIVAMQKPKKVGSSKSKADDGRKGKEPANSRLNEHTTKLAAKKAPPKRGMRENSKLATVIAMLRSPKGATIEALSKATGWQTHSVRGVISGAIKKKLGLTVASVKTDGARTYRINA